MQSMVLTKICSLHDCKTPLTFIDLPEPVPGPGEILIHINACGVCHTELDEIEGRTPALRRGHRVSIAKTIYK